MAAPKFPDELYVMLRKEYSREDAEDDDDEDEDENPSYDKRFLFFTTKEAAVRHAIGRKILREIAIYKVAIVGVPKIELVDAVGNPVQATDDEIKQAVRRKIRRAV